MVLVKKAADMRVLLTVVVEMVISAIVVIVAVAAVAVRIVVELWWRG